MSRDDFVTDGEPTSEQLAPFEDAYREGFARLAVLTPPAPDMPVVAGNDPPTRDRRWVVALAAAAVLALLVGIGVRGFDQRPDSPASQHTSASSASPSSRPSPSVTPTLSPSSIGALTPAELELATWAARGAFLAPPNVRSPGKAWVTRSTYREFFRIVDPEFSAAQMAEIETKWDEPILVVLVVTSVNSTEPPLPGPTGELTSMMMLMEPAEVERTGAFTATRLYPRDALRLMYEFPGPIMPLDLTE